MAKQKLKIDAERLSHFKWWEKVDDIVSGQRDRICTSKYIIPYRTEIANEGKHKGLFKNRLKRSPNKVESPGILTQHATSLAQKISIEGFEGGMAEDILDNVDGWGSNAQNMFSERIYYYLKHGQIGTLVEAPAEVSDNLLESQQRGERSYQILYQAKDILKLSYFTQGPRKGTIREVYLRESDRMVGEERFERVRRYFFPTEMGEEGIENISETYAVQILERRARENETYKLYPGEAEEREYDVVEELQGSLGNIPFIVSGKGPKDSELYSILDMDISLLNLYSMRRSINYNQCFRITAIFGVRDEELISKIGEYMVHVFPEEGGKIESIEPSSPEAIEREIVEFKADIRDTAFRRQNSKLLDGTRQVQSAESRAKDLITLENVYNDTLDYLEKQEQMIYQVQAIFEGINPELVLVSTQRDFGLNDPEISRLDESMLLANAAKIQDPVAYNRICQEVMKNQVDKLDVPYETKAEIKELLDQASFTNPATAPRAANSPRVLDTLRRQRQNLLADANGAAA